MSAPRRNEPCACGSGRRYKDCHGRLDGAGPSLDLVIQRALKLHHGGQVDAAERDYREILARDPGNAIATHYLGMIAWHRGDIAEGERGVRAGIAGDPAIADFHNNLGLLLRDTGRLDEAVASFTKTLEIDPRWYHAHSNMGLAHEAAGRWDDAVAAHRSAIAIEPRSASSQQNLARVLILRGEFAEGFARYQWRLPAQGLTKEAPDENVRPLAQSLPGVALMLVSEQGLGDVLFFLRFAPELVRRGAKLGFRGDARLNSILARTGLFELGIAELDAPATPAELGRKAIYVGELPWLLKASEVAFPPPLALAPLPERVERLRTVLEAQGPPPYIALTWRAGLPSTGPSHAQLKVIDVEVLGETLRGIPATWISVQRRPGAGERERLSSTIGAPVRDFSAANDDLEEMLALLSAADGYIGVSNANAYLRTGAGRPMQVLVPHPPEWRWGIEGARSPWFANVGVYRQRPDGDWSAAMRTLRERLTSRAIS